MRRGSEIGASSLRPIGPLLTQNELGASALHHRQHTTHTNVRDHNHNLSVKIFKTNKSSLSLLGSVSLSSDVPRITSCLTHLTLKFCLPPGTIELFNNIIHFRECARVPRMICSVYRSAFIHLIFSAHPRTALTPGATKRLLLSGYRHPTDGQAGEGRSYNDTRRSAAEHCCPRC